ncbi:DUF4056 domain-containing protein [Kineococcus indalonis]|uniref:DUF4056 domain-containing protein n=1 Tax=Kineococcus indalonis TaxID=2696566 RepID=UPI001411FC2A|nr:DUF4056 domain-containing protein [Kineococcus indalonis]NAZ88027.1 DUF4056 domain-containing protein [Kineococcus indalonis]
MLRAAALRGRAVRGTGPTLEYGGYGSRTPGIVFTGAVGFVDLGHLYAVVDVTAYAYQAIHAARGAAGTRVTTAEGTATLTGTAPAGEWLELARSIAYDDALAHEIFSYDLTYAVGMHNSSFSPEDLCSNHLGTVVAARALRAGGRFPAAAEERCRELLTSLNVQNPNEARHAFEMIDDLWVDAAAGISSPGYLKRRNFSRAPWHVHRHPAGGRVPTGLLDPFAVTSTYTYRHTAGFTGADFAARTASIRQHAASRYGPCYDQPT